MSLGAEYQIDVTLFDNSPLVGTSSAEEYRVYVPWKQNDATFAELGRWSNTGTGEVGTGYQNAPDGGRAPDGSGLPSRAYVDIENSSGNWRRIEVKFPRSNSVNRVGVFYATTTRGEYSLKIPIIKIREDATIKPSNYTKTIGIGESVTLSVTADSIDSSKLRWVHNNGDVITAWSGLSQVTIDNVRMGDGGIYECFEEGKRQLGEHAIMRLIVRACPSPKYGSDCSSNCKTCWNGGICAADNGVCLCQPGFAGEQCENRIDSNHWGAQGSLFCSSSGGNCRTALICGPDPIGCSCVAGYRGLDCRTACPDGMYGSNCNRECHCDTGVCDKATGCEANSNCWSGYLDEHCQGHDRCTDGFFGAQCEFSCHCEGEGRCNQHTGVCDSGGCAYGWGGEDCQQALPYFFDTAAVSANSSSTTIEITWTAWNQNIDYGTTPNQYRIYYWKTHSSDIEANYTTSMHAFVSIQDLVPETSYTFAIAAVKIVNGVSLEGPRNMKTSATTECGAPSLAPTIIVVQVAEDQANLNWSVPDGSDWIQCSQGLNGFVISQQSANKTRTIRVNNGAITSLEIDSLSPCTQHEFRIKATNKDAEGNLSSQENITIFGAPGMTTYISYTNDMLKWREPESVCKVIDYVVDVELINSDQCNETTEHIIVDGYVNNPMITLSSLMYFSTYEATIKARSGSNKFAIGDPARKKFTTRESVPSGAPTNIVSQPSNQMVVSWKQPACGLRHGNIILYEYEFLLAEAINVSRVNTTKTRAILSDLFNDKEFEFRIRAYTNKGPGPFSKKITIKSFTGSNSSGVTGIVVGILMALVLIVIILLIFIYRKRRAQNSLGTKDTQLSQQQRTVYENTGFVNPVDVEISEDNSAVSPAPRPAINVPSFSRNKPVDLKDFMQYVKVRKTGGPNHELKKDFEDLPEVDDETYSWTVAKKPENKTKNRYKNIVTYDHSRVVLEKFDGDENSDYINASYINGYNMKKAYIASQGPNSSTVNDMWRMVWQENVENIIMVTGLKEGIKIKCEQYWPNVGKGASYGDYTVSNTKEEDMGFYVVRHLNISKTEIYANQASSDARVIRHFHYIGWPDMGVPEFAEPVLKYLEHVNSCISPNAGPVVVHCSAGIGRTGTFIAIDTMLKMAKEENTVDVFNFVKEMRHSRPGMIQTEHQYTFVHDALLEALFCGETTLSTSEIEKTWHAVEQAMDGQDNYIRAQFKTLASMFPPLSKMEYAVGNLPENRSKIRCSKYIPPDSNRPKLSTSEISNQFVNAGFAHGHGKRNMYLTTQVPLPTTVTDFWRMIFDYELKTIVTLYNPDEMDETYGTYLPSDESLSCGQFLVEATDTVQNGNAVETKLKLFKTDDSLYMNTPTEIHLIQYIEWQSHETFPSSAASLVRLLDCVNAHRRCINDQRIVVIDRDGVSRCGTFCAVMSIVDQIKDQQQVDVFRSVKRLKVCRREMINTMEQYTFCYEAARAYLKSFETYSNFV